MYECIPNCGQPTCNDSLNPHEIEVDSKCGQHEVNYCPELHIHESDSKRNDTNDIKFGPHTGNYNSYIHKHKSRSKHEQYTGNCIEHNIVFK